MRTYVYIIGLLVIIVIFYAYVSEPFTVMPEYIDSNDALIKLQKLDAANQQLIAYLLNKYKNTDKYQDIVFLYTNYKPFQLQENKPTWYNQSTSYVRGKGTVFKLCLRNQQDGKLHSDNTLMFVNLHELSHLLNRTYGHEDDFWQSFIFILNNAVELGIYKPIDYRLYPEKYCTLMINRNPMFG